MSPVDALMPNTAALHRHVAAAAALSCKSVKSVSRKTEPQHLKYVVIEDPRGVEHLILFSRTLNHAEVIPCLCNAVSAGFVMFYDGAVCIPDIDSTTLNKGPRPQDKALISSILNHQQSTPKTIDKQ